MNLPLEYSKLSKYYDALSSAGADARNRRVEEILKKYQVKTVLDLTCGTGSQVLWLAKHGYEVTGSDFSPALLEIAKDKAYKENLKVPFLEGDMRSAQVGSFDVVITIFNAVGHLTKPDFEKAMRNIRRNLHDGGIYVFDIFNLSSMTDALLVGLSMDDTATVGSTTIRHAQHSKFDHETRRLVSYDHFTVQEGSGEPQMIEGEFALQIYTAAELREMLTRNGFAVLEQCSMDGTAFSEATTESIVTIARRV